MDLLGAGADIGYNLASNKVFDAYNKQVSNLRETLLGNKISYVGGNSEMDKATKAYHNKVFAYSTALQILQQVTQSSLNKKLAATKAKEEDNMLNTYYDKQVPQAKKADDATTEYYNQLGKLSDNTISSNINQALIADKEQDQYGLDVAARRDELDKLTYKNWTGNEGIGNNAESEKRIKKFWEDHKGGDEISEDLKSSGFESNSVTFPRPGETIETHKTENGIKFVNRAKFEILNDGKKETIFKGWTKNGKVDEDKYSTPSNPMSEKVARMVEEYRRANPGSYKFFIEKLHGKGVNDKFFGKNPIQEGKTRSDFPNRMLFPAYINAFNDSYDATWNAYNFIGRGEEVGIYNKTARKLSLDFYIISDFSAELLVNAIEEERASSNPPVKATGDSKLNFKKPDLNMNSFTTAKDMVMNAAQGGGNSLKGLSKEETLSELKRLLPDWGTGAYPIPGVVNGEWSGTIGGQISGTPEMLWARLTFLAQCVYPWYRKDGKLKEQPMVRIRIGDFIDAVGRIDSLSLSEYDAFDMDLNESSIGAIPMGVKVGLSMTIIHEDEPTSNYSRFYWRKDFDSEAGDYVPASLSEISETMDSTLDVSKTGSAMHFEDPASAFGETNQTFPKADIQKQEELSKFKSSMKKLKASAGNLNDAAKTALLKTTLLAAKKLLESKLMAQASQLKNLNTEENLKVANVVKDNKGKVATLMPKAQEDPSKPAENPLKKKVKLFGSTGN